MTANKSSDFEEYRKLEKILKTTEKKKEKLLKKYKEFLTKYAKKRNISGFLLKNLVLEETGFQADLYTSYTSIEDDEYNEYLKEKKFFKYEDLDNSELLEKEADEKNKYESEHAMVSLRYTLPPGFDGWELKKRYGDQEFTYYTACKNQKLLEDLAGGPIKKWTWDYKAHSFGHPQHTQITLYRKDYDKIQEYAKTEYNIGIAAYISYRFNYLMEKEK